jgi:two-component system, LuxR family, sensor kinase FixL
MAETERHLQQQILQISEREQRRIGQDLHDSLCQWLTAIAFMSQTLQSRLDTLNLPEGDLAREITRNINESCKQAHRMANGLSPVALGEAGLVTALQDLAKRAKRRHPEIEFKFRCGSAHFGLENDVATHLFRVAQEAVVNAAKHSMAGTVSIGIRLEEDSVVLSVEDNGWGLPTQPLPSRKDGGGMGMHIMRYRARSIGASLRVLNREAGGTRVECALPRAG